MGNQCVLRASIIVIFREVSSLRKQPPHIGRLSNPPRETFPREYVGVTRCSLAVLNTLDYYLNFLHQLARCTSLIGWPHTRSRKNAISKCVAPFQMFLIPNIITYLLDCSHWRKKPVTAELTYFSMQ